MYNSNLKRVLLLVLQLSFPKDVTRFRAILRPLETAPPCSAGSAGPIVTPLPPSSPLVILRHHGPLAQPPFEQK